MLRQSGPLDRRLDVADRLRAAGLGLRAAHAALSRLADTGLAVCTIAEGADVPALARDLAALGVEVLRERTLDAGVLTAARQRHGLSQREFAALLGIELDTLQNWEQGRNRPDAAALRLACAFDQAPALVTAVALEAVG